MSAVTTAPVVSALVSVAGTRGAGARVATTRAPSKRTHQVLAATFAGSAESRLALRSSRATTLGRDARRARGGVFNVLADTTTTDAKPAAEAKPEPELLSDRGVDYKPFRDLLAAGEWEKADDEHRRLMCVLGGEDAEDRGWVYFTEARDFPVADLKTIDALWVHFSEGRHGFSVQRKLWVGAKRQWPKFFKQIDWVQGENDNYRKWPEEFDWRKEAARGHMPLTNALRGTTLLESLLEHPAFAPPKKPQEELASQLEEAGDKLQSAMANLPGLKGLKKPSWMK